MNTPPKIPATKLTVQLQDLKLGTFRVNIHKGGPAPAGYYELCLGEARQLRDDLNQAVVQYEQYLLKRSLVGD